VKYVIIQNNIPTKTPDGPPRRARSRKASGLPPHDRARRGALIGDRRATRPSVRAEP